MNCNSFMDKTSDVFDVSKVAWVDWYDVLGSQFPKLKKDLETQRLPCLLMVEGYTELLNTTCKMTFGNCYDESISIKGHFLKFVETNSPEKILETPRFHSFVEWCKLNKYPVDGTPMLKPSNEVVMNQGPKLFFQKGSFIQFQGIQKKLSRLTRFMESCFADKEATHNTIGFYLLEMFAPHLVIETVNGLQVDPRVLNIGLMKKIQTFRVQLNVYDPLQIFIHLFKRRMDILWKMYPCGDLTKEECDYFKDVSRIEILCNSCLKQLHFDC